MGEVLRPRIVNKPPANTDLFVVGCFAREKPATAGLAARVVTAARQAVERRGFKGRDGQRASTRSSAPGTPQVEVWGLGQRSSCDLARLGRWLERAAAAAGRDGFGRVLFVLPAHEALSGRERAAVLLRRLALTRYRFEEFRAKPDRHVLRSASVLPPADQTGAYREAAKIAVAVARGAALTRDLANTPANVATPEWMADRAVELAEETGLEAVVLDEEQLAEKGMGGILAVGEGSERPPRLVRLSGGDGPVAVSLVGKGVTFDTGGISIKPARTMDEMKFDKSGACTVLGVARAVHELGLPLRMRYYLPLAENMPDGRAYRPGDVVRCYNGKTVEVLNTDAEGRMILADALTWAEEESPDWLIDYATLTGACVVALGQNGAGLFSHADDLAADLLAAAAEAEEPLWRLPMWREFSRAIRGQHGDLRNVAGRWGGASTAAAFLAEFVGQQRRWAHLDIAGPAYRPRARPKTFGATGFGVALTAAWLTRVAGRA